MGQIEFNRVRATTVLPHFPIIAGLLAAAVATTAQAQNLKLSYNSDWPPYSAGPQTSVAGILPELMREIVEVRMGLGASHHGAPWNRAQGEVEKGRLDAFVTVPTAARLKYASLEERGIFH